MACFSDFSMTWDGTTTERTSGNVTTTLLRLPEFPTAAWEPVVTQGWEGAAVQQGTPVAGGMDGVFWLKITTSSTDRTTGEREILDEWSTLNTIYNPFDGEVALQTTRKDTGASDVVRNLAVRALETPACNLMMDPNAGGLMGEQLYALYPVRFRALYPLFVQNGAESDNQTATTGGATLTTNDNDGVRGVPYRLVVTSVTNSPTLLTIAAAHLPVAYTITNPANDDYVDVGYTTRGVVEDGTGGDLSVGVGGDVPVANTDWTVTTTGATSTCVVTINYKPEFGTW